LEVEVVVVENGQPKETAALLQDKFPQVRLIVCENRGFAHANNVGLRTIKAPFVLLLNPDTEITEGTLETLLAGIRANGNIGLAGGKQVTPDGELWPTIRRFPNAVRSLFEGLGSERYPFRASWLGERELDPSLYDLEVDCDWTSGSFMLLRRDALESVGLFDERFFLYCEEPDICRRLKTAGWQVRHVPLMTILHHAGRGRWSPGLAAQEAFARRQYVAKHFSRTHRLAAIVAMAVGYSLRSVFGGSDSDVNRERRTANRAALATVLGLRPPPFGTPPRQAILGSRSVVQLVGDTGEQHHDP